MRVSMGARDHLCIASWIITDVRSIHVPVTQVSTVLSIRLSCRGEALDGSIFVTLTLRSCGQQDDEQCHAHQ